MEGRRAQFFNHHMDVLAPFITTKAADAIRWIAYHQIDVWDGTCGMC